MKLSRKAIQRMVDSGQVNIGGRRTGSGGGGGGGVSATWVEENYISKEFFNTLFTVHGHDADDTAVPPTDVIIEPNDTETVLDSIEAMVGLWTEKYLSALGLSSGGGGGGDVLAEPLVSINGIGSPTAANRTLVWNGTQWTFQPYGQGGGSVTSIRITVPAGFNVSPSTAITTAGTFAITFATGYSLPTTAKQNNWDSAYSIASTLGGYFDASGNAKSALKLTTVSKTAWGRTYWTANGVPDSISGDIENAANIKIDNNKRVSWKKAGATNYLSMLTLDADNNFIVGESMASEGLATYVRGRSINFQTGMGSSGNHTATLDANGVLTVEKLVIGSITIEHDTTNGGLHIVNAGLYADNYISALGANSGGGGGGDVLAEPLVSINGIGSPTAANQTLVWDGTRWTFKPYGQGGGSVTSIKITVPTGFNVSPSTAITTAGTFAITFATGYSLPTTAKQTNWDTAYTNNHTHSNKTVLDGITPTKVSNWDTAYSKANTLEGYFDTSGNAKSALKLTTVSKTAWGRTYWTANGVPADIDGDMTSVGNISFSASGKNIGGVAYFDTTNSRLGIGTTSPSTSLHVVGRVTCEYDSTKLGSFSNVRGEYLSNYGINRSGFTVITTGQSSSSSSTVRISMTPYNAEEPYILFGASDSIKMGTTISNNTETYRDGTYIQIGGARIVWDDTNKALKVIQSDNSTAANFYATGAVSALGANSSSSGGVGDVTWSALASSSDTRQIAASHLSSVTQPLYFLFNDDANPTVTYDGKTNKAVGNILTKSYADGRYVKQSGNAIISGTATIGGNMTIGATEAVGTVNSQVIQTLNSRAIYIKTGSAPNFVDGTWSSTSDIRLKDIINNVGASVDQIANAPIFNYKWKSGGVSIMLGSSAQYWQNVFQHAVEIGPENYLYMDYSSVALASAVMVARKVVNHEERIRQLERENKELRKLLNIA